VVDVGNDRDIANLGAFGFAAHGACVLKGGRGVGVCPVTPRRALLIRGQVAAVEDAALAGSRLELLLTPWLESPRDGSSKEEAGDLKRFLIL
jgi:hypothetical protein